MELNSDKHPQLEIIFGGKWEHREAEIIDAENFIARKGIAAKGKKASPMDLKSIRFIEPLHKPEDDIDDEPLDIIERDTDRDNYMTAKEAMEYGLIDKVIEKRA